MFPEVWLRPLVNGPTAVSVCAGPPPRAAQGQPPSEGSTLPRGPFCLLPFPEEHPSLLPFSSIYQHQEPRRGPASQAAEPPRPLPELTGAFKDEPEWIPRRDCFSSLGQREPQGDLVWKGSRDPGLCWPWPGTTGPAFQPSLGTWAWLGAPGPTRVKDSLLGLHRPPAAVGGPVPQGFTSLCVWP